MVLGHKAAGPGRCRFLGVSGWGFEAQSWGVRV